MTGPKDATSTLRTEDHPTPARPMKSARPSADGDRRAAVDDAARIGRPRTPVESIGAPDARSTEDVTERDAVRPATVELEGGAQSQQLRELRRSIDNLDGALAAILSERFRLTEKVGVLKSRLGLAVADPAREREQEARYRSIAASVGLREEILVALMAFIHAHVKERHEALRRQT